MRVSDLLTIDAVINLVLGAFLLFFPADLVAILGVPDADGAFYPSLLGAVLAGIGVALLIERFRRSDGLGLLGAISINVSGGLVLAAWLILGGLDLPWHGQAILWALVVILVSVSLVELSAMIRHRAAPAS